MFVRLINQLNINPNEVISRLMFHPCVTGACVRTKPLEVLAHELFMRY